MVFLIITYGDEETIEIDVENNCTFEKLRETISKDVNMDKDKFHITREEWNDKVTSWEVMDNNTIVDSSHRYTLIVYSHEEWNNMGSDYESDYDTE